MRSIALSILILISVLGSTLGEDSAVVKYLRAEGEGGCVRIESPEGEDWKTFAPKLVGRYSGIVASSFPGSDTVDYDSLSWTNHFFGPFAEVEYDVPTSAWVHEYHYYLLSADGVVELVPDVIRGVMTVKWGLDGIKRPDNLNIRYSGYVQSKPLPNQSTETGGIVIASREAMEVSVQDAKLSLFDVLHAKMGCNHSKEAHAIFEEKVGGPVAKYRVNTNRGSYVFVMWCMDYSCAAEERKCQYSLVDGNDLSKDIAYNSSKWRQSN